MFNLQFKYQVVSIVVLDHTADLRVRVEGRSFPIVLLKLGNFMMTQIYGTEIKMEREVSSEVEADEKENCVVRYLNDLLYTSESKQFEFRVKSVQIGNGKLRWTGAGHRIRSVESEREILIKAATYDRLSVSTDPAIVEITFDI
jgi:SHS2 domain-containing protein